MWWRGLGAQLHACQHPKIMHQHGPGDRQGSVDESFAAHPPVEEYIFDNADAPLGLAAAPLQSFELPRTAPLAELSG